MSAAVRFSEFATCAVAAVSLIALNVPAYSQNQNYTPEFQKVLEAAKKEGSVSWYVGTGRRTAAEENRFSDAIEKMFGFRLAVKFDADTTVTVQMNKLVNEAKAGVQPTIDLFSGTITNDNALLKNGVVVPTDWAALGFKPELVEPRVYGTVMWNNLRTAFYNTNLVKGADIPKDWSDLLNPKWKGRIVTAATASVFAPITASYGEQKTYALMERLLSEQKMAFNRSITGVPTAVASGEFAIGISGSIGEMRNKGAPIAYAPFPKNVSVPDYGVVLKNARHPNAARVFAYFATQTPEGKALLWRIFGWSMPDVPNSDAAELFTPEKKVDLTYDWYFDQHERALENTRRILNLR